MMTDAQLAEIKARAEAATPGPWEVWDGCSWRRIGRRRDLKRIVEPIAQRDGHPDLLAQREDLEFIAAARADVPALLAEVDRLRGMLAERPA